MSADIRQRHPRTYLWSHGGPASLPRSCRVGYEKIDVRLTIVGRRRFPLGCRPISAIVPGSACRCNCFSCWKRTRRSSAARLPITHVSEAQSERLADTCWVLGLAPTPSSFLLRFGASFQFVTVISRRTGTHLRLVASVCCCCRCCCYCSCVGGIHLLQQHSTTGQLKPFS